MKTRTLLLLSVGTALAILVAGGVLLLQLSGQQNTVEPSDVGTEVRVGDLLVTVVDVEEQAGVFGVAVRLGGVEDGLDNIRLVTGDGRLEPITVPADGRCTEIELEVRSCRVDFDVSGVDSSNRTLVVRRGDDQANWNLTL